MGRTPSFKSAGRSGDFFLAPVASLSFTHRCGSEPAGGLGTMYSVMAGVSLASGAPWASSPSVLKPDAR